MTCLSALPTEHSELHNIASLIWDFAKKHGLSTIERDESLNKKVTSLDQAKMYIDRAAISVMNEAPLHTADDVTAELNRFAQNKQKPTRSKLGNFVISTLIRAAFWRECTSELLWIFGIEIADEKLKLKLSAYHTKVMKELLKA